jgi:Pregnancy-associated plasma protein-A
MFLQTINSSSAQHPICLKDGDKSPIDKPLLDARLNQKTKSNFTERSIRINIHFVLRSDGTGNFTETGDNLGNSLSGYKFAKDFMSRAATTVSYNTRMNIPPNNTIPVLDPKYHYILDAVYFHRNDNFFTFNANGDLMHDALGADKEEVFNVFLTEDISLSTSGGYASTISHVTAYKYIEIANFYGWTYLNYVYQNPIGTIYDYVMHGTSGTIAHEVGHLLGLRHTVQYGRRIKCPTPSREGYIDYSCDDDCADTPTAWSIYEDPNNYDPTNPIDPRTYPECGWATGGRMWCSNNMMDYNGSNALTPCQLEIIHAGLDGGLKSFTACEAVKNNLILNDIGYPKFAYFGKHVEIGHANLPVADLAPTEEATVYFSNDIVMDNIIIYGAFEAIRHDACN